MVQSTSPFFGCRAQTLSEKPLAGSIVICKSHFGYDVLLRRGYRKHDASCFQLYSAHSDMDRPVCQKVCWKNEPLCSDVHYAVHLVKRKDIRAKVVF